MPTTHDPVIEDIRDMAYVARMLPKDCNGRRLYPGAKVRYREFFWRVISIAKHNVTIQNKCAVSTIDPKLCEVM